MADNVLPDKMKALRIHKFGKAQDVIQFEELPLPKPAEGEVLIHVGCTPINPADLTYIAGALNPNATLPLTPGFEGSGTVVQSGGGLMGWYLNGKKVAFKSEGAWAEYVVAKAEHVISLDDDVDLKNYACTFINPLTVLTMAELVTEGKHRAVVQTAACSSIGKMINRYFFYHNIPVINIVRREQQVQMLEKEFGAQNILVLSTHSPNFDLELKDLAQKTSATICFDAVGGSLTSRVLNVLPNGSEMYVYGSLSGETTVTEIDPTDFLFERKKLRGLKMMKLDDLGSFQKMKTFWDLKKSVKDLLSTRVEKEYELGQFKEAIEHYDQNRSLGKVLLINKGPVPDTTLSTKAKKEAEEAQKKAAEAATAASVKAEQLAKEAKEAANKAGDKVNEAATDVKEKVSSATGGDAAKPAEDIKTTKQQRERKETNSKTQ